LIVSFIAEAVTGTAIWTERTARTGIVASFGFVSTGFSTVVSEDFTAKHALEYKSLEALFLKTYVASACMTIIHANECFILKSFFAIQLTVVSFVGVRVFRNLFSFFISNARASMKAMVVTRAEGKAIFVLPKTFVHLIVVAI